MAHWPSREFIINSLAYARTAEDLERISATMITANALSISFLVSKNYNCNLKLKAEFSTFYSVYPSFGEQIEEIVEGAEGEIALTKVWKRVDFRSEWNGISPDSENVQTSEIDIAKLEADLFADDKRWIGGNKVPVSELHSEESYDTWLRSEIKECEKKDTTNITPWKPVYEFSRTEFNDNEDLINIKLVNRTQKPPQGRLSREDPAIFACNLTIDLGETETYPFELEMDDKIDLRCTNCYAEKSGNIIQTSSGPKHRDYRTQPSLEFRGNKLLFTELKNHKSSIKLLEELGSYLNDYSRLGEDTANFNTKFSDGLDLIRNDANVLKAFTLMQETFELSSKDKFDSWYLFQMAFCVQMIPSLTKRTSKEEKAALLHVPTGGGKSESYFALVVFLSFYDRLVGKGLGVSAWTKFPLRMLSIQQLERIAKIFVWAEDLRQQNDIGGEPFSIGYLVGESNEFPNQTWKLAKEIIQNEERNEKTPGKIIRQCPICEGNVHLKLNDNFSISHNCDSCKRIWNFFFDDEQIYRFAPTFVVSTVDKLAAISWNRGFRNLFGGTLRKCPKGHGFVPSGDKCSATNNLKSSRRKCNEAGINFEYRNIRPGPSLFVQDELHLIKEGFGLIDSHFETLLQTFQKRIGDGTGAKYLGMTATIKGADHQVKHLYDLKTEVYPGNYSDNNPFFNDISYESGKPELQRLFLGLKPNGRDNNYACLLTVKFISQFLKIKSDEGIAKEIIDMFAANLTYHGKKADTNRMNTYLSDVVKLKVEKEDIRVTGEVLTGDKDLDGIRKSIIDVEEHDFEGDGIYKMHTVFSTSVVSHGVDINRWNIMQFQGMPNHTSEYIQAFSRVGRKFPSIVLVWFYPNRIRDLSYYRNFSLYHQTIHERVEEIPINRWARLGLKETLTATMNGVILNYLAEKLGRQMYRVDAVNSLTAEQREEITDFLIESYRTSEEPNIGAEIETEIRIGVEERLRELQKYTGANPYYFPAALAESERPEFSTPFGMRGIQPSLELKPIFDDGLYISKFKK